MQGTLSLTRDAGSTSFTPPRKPAPEPRRVLAYIVLAVLLAASIWSTIELKINIATIIDSARNAVSFLSRMFPLDWPGVGEVVHTTLVTLAIVPAVCTG